MQVTAATVKALRDRTGAGMMDCKRALVETSGDIEAAVELMRKSGQAKADKRAGRIAAEGRVAIALAANQSAGAMVEVNCETDFVAKEDAFREFVDMVAARAVESRPDGVAALVELPVVGGPTTIEERRRELVAKIGENITVRRLALLDAGDARVGAYVHGGRIGVLVEIEGGDDAVAKDLAMHIAASRPAAVGEADLPGEILAKEEDILRAQVAESGKPPAIQEKMVAGRLAKYLREVTLLGQPFVKDPERSVEKYLQAAGARARGFVRFEVGEGIEKRAENFAEEVMAQVRDSAAG